MYDYEALKELAKDRGCSVKDLLALSPKNDPFYMGTPGDVSKGEWFAGLYRRAGYSVDNAPHLRRCHYWIVSQKTQVLMPDGRPYENTELCWNFLMEASKVARYLGLVELNGIKDNKNPQPNVFAKYFSNQPAFEVQVPDLTDPEILLYGLHHSNVQPYHCEVWCEKSTMNDVLMPIIEKYHANLVTFEGEVSITAVMVSLMQRLVQSRKKPMRIFYISDFDPAGNSMPVAMSRKLEYALQLYGMEDLDVKVRPIALTAEMVERYQLPRIPIKESERRAEKFEAAFGGGAVELDALEAIYPGVLAKLVGSTLEEYWSDEAADELNRQIRTMQRELQTETGKITAKYADQIDALKQMQDELKAFVFDVTKYRVGQYDPEVEEWDDDWLFSTERDYEDQIGYYKRHKGVDVA